MSLYAITTVVGLKFMLDSKTSCKVGIALGVGMGVAYVRYESRFSRVKMFEVHGYTGAS